jgi:DNA-binding NarL/FixJ family response regulator
VQEKIQQTTDNQAKKNKRILLVDSCQCTVLGLKLLIDFHFKGAEVNVTKTFSQEIMKPFQQRADLIVCGIGCQPGDFSQLLLLPEYATCPCVLMTDKTCEVLNRIFLAAGYRAVVSKQASLAALTSLLSLALSTPRNAMANDARQRYQAEEAEVLSALLKGNSPQSVAQDMGISYRAVSRYKLSGLKRAGVRNLNEILLQQKLYLSI